MGPAAAPASTSVRSSSTPGFRTLLVAQTRPGAATHWIPWLTFRPRANAARLVAAATAGFNCIWIVSFVGLPVVGASVVVIAMSVVGVPRRRAIAMVAPAIAAFVLGLVVLRLTEPP